MPNPAMAAALALASAPTLASVMRSRSLPDGIGALLGAFARREEAISELIDMTGLDRLALTDCIDNYIQKVVLHSASDPYRLLAGAPSSSREELRRHMKLLLEGLHPDKAVSSWKSAYAPRVIEAWREVSSGRAVAQLPPTSASRGRRRLPLIAHPLPPDSVKIRWRLAVAVLTIGGAITWQWRSLEGSLIALARGLSP